MSFLGAQNSIALGVQGLIHIDTGVVGSADYLLAKSLRFRSSASAYLNRTPATTGTGGSKTWTYSGWIKRGVLGTRQSLLDGYAASAGHVLEFQTADTLDFYGWGAGAAALELSTTQVFRDPAAWYHIVLAVDTTQATSSDRIKLYVNGSQVTSFGTATYPTQNVNTYISSNVVQDIGRRGDAQFYADGEQAEINFVDGQALAPTAFGAYSIYNQWLPIRYAGTYGTNGFYLPFTNTASTSTLVADSSGNANNWTPNNISLTAGITYDSLTDVPTLTSTTVANYAVWNPLWQGRTNVPTNGNLDYPASSVGIGTMDLSSNSFYWEITSTGGTSTVAVYSTSASSSIGVTTGLTYGFRFNGSTGAFDYTTNGTTFTSIATGLTSGPYFIYVSTAAATTASLNAGQRSLAYTAPSGFLPLNTFNIAAGTVTTSGTFTGNLSTDGPFVYLNGTPTAMTINGNAVTFGTQADKLANGFKVRSSSILYNLIGSNTYVATTVGEVFKYEDAQSNP
jgi:hypothetical protein